MASDLGGWTTLQPTLQYWGKWLVESLRYGAILTWPSILLRFYLTADPLASAIGVALLAAAVCFLSSLPTNNHSFVDKIWSLIPVYYAWHFALHDIIQHPNVPLNPRAVIIAVLVSIWGARLTYNFARKGGYKWSAEDYRWPILRERINKYAFLVFNLTFIAVYQNLLLLSLVTPAYLAWQNAGRHLNIWDALATALCVFFIVFETVADQQQWVFQSVKHAKLAAGKRLTGEYAKGFLTSGLWRYSRHPNFWAEQSLWCSMYLFGVAATGRWLNWTIVAPVQLILLFQGSTRLTEKLSAAKYPQYANYQATTSCFFPLPPLGKASSAAGAPATPAGRAVRRSSRTAEAAVAPSTPTATTDDEGVVPPSTAPKRRARPRSAAAASQEAQEAPATSDSARPARSPRKTERALASEKPAATRQSSRLRTKVSA